MESKKYKFKSPINIYDSGKIIELSTGIYSVKVLGGWDVIVGAFNFSLKNTATNRVVKPKVTYWGINAYEHHKLAKKIMVLDVPEYGNYVIEFENQNSLKVWSFSMPFISRPFQPPIANHLLQICIG